MGVVDPRGGSDAWFKAVFGGQTRGRGRNDMEQVPDTETLPPGAAAGVPCPRCGGAMRVLPGPPLPTKVPTLFIGCSGCGFVGLRAAAAPGPEAPSP